MVVLCSYNSNINRFFCNRLDVRYMGFTKYVDGMFYKTRLCLVIRYSVLTHVSSSRDHTHTILFG